MSGSAGSSCSSGISSLSLMSGKMSTTGTTPGTAPAPSKKCSEKDCIDAIRYDRDGKMLNVVNINGKETFLRRPQTARTHQEHRAHEQQQRGARAHQAWAEHVRIKNTFWEDSDGKCFF